MSEPSPIDAADSSPAEIAIPKSAMVLAAGLGTRMRGTENDPPKPLREVGGQTLLGRLLDELVASGVQEIVVNVHHKADAIEAFLAQWKPPHIRVHISDERDLRLETGGGVKKALPLLSEDPFIVCNADVLWRHLDFELRRLANRFAHFENRHGAIDGCLLLAPINETLGYDGRGDFKRDPEGRLTRGPDAYVYTGLQMLRAPAVAALPDGPVSLNHLFDTAIACGKLVGEPMSGQWIHVGTPEALAEAEILLARDELT